MSQKRKRTLFFDPPLQLDPVAFAEEIADRIEGLKDSCTINDPGVGSLEALLRDVRNDLTDEIAGAIREVAEEVRLARGEP